MLSRSVATVISLLSLTLVAGTPLADNGRLAVYGPVPGLAPSPYYRLQVREEGSHSWLDTFTLVTECTADKFCNTTGMYNGLKDWSNSYINFQMKEGVEVEVKITKLYGEAVTKAVVHPREAARKVEVRGGKIHLSLDRPALFTVDINGQMEEQDTGKGYR